VKAKKGRLKQLLSKNKRESINEKGQNFWGLHLELER
jgi:hypothetical protein